MSMVAREWWREDNSQLLPGEQAGTTVFAVQFQDGCCHVGYTNETVFVRLCELRGDPLDRGADTLVKEHVQRMVYLVHCVASGLEESCAKELRDQLVSRAPGDVYVAVGTMVTTSDCWLREGEPDAEVMSFAEWVTTNDSEANAGNPE